LQTQGFKNKSFEDLDKEILKGQPAIHDGCGAVVALIVGEKLFTAVVGKVNAILCTQEPKKRLTDSGIAPVSLGSAQGKADLPEEQKWLQENGGTFFQAENGGTFVSSPNGAAAAVTRSLGDRAWKGTDGGIPGSVKLLRGSPETRVTDLLWAEKHQFIVILSAPVADVVDANEAITIGTEFAQRPRAASGEIAVKNGPRSNSGTAHAMSKGCKESEQQCKGSLA